MTVLTVGWATQADRFVRGYTPDQPVPFRHKLYAGSMKIPCEHCHTGVQRARHGGIPSVQTCMNCHTVTRTDSPSIQKLAGLARTGEALPWKRIHRLPDHVFFDHRPHVAAGIACQTCHGEVQDMEVASQRMSMRMGNCLGCHRDASAALPPGSPPRKGSENCNACHR